MLIVLSRSPSEISWCPDFIEAACCDHKNITVFITLQAAVLSSPFLPGSGDYYAFQQRLLNLQKTCGIKLLCCGRALREQGYDPHNLQEGFEAAGYMELVASLMGNDEVVQC